MKKCFFILLVLFSFISCSSGGSDDSDSDNETNLLLTDVNDWGYWLTDPDISELVDSDYDLLVIDYSNDGSEEGEFSSDDIQSLKNTGKIVLAYMSIGEAEEGRFYFESDWVDSDTKDILDGAPDFLVESNPDFPDNYKVRYWEEEWQNIIFGTQSGDDKSYLDRIINAGFDGVYLDIIDAFEFFGPDGEMPERPTAATDMIDFVIAISDYAHNTRGVSDFLVFPQNGAAILDDQEDSEYLEAVDGIGAEDTFYFGDEENDNDLDLDHAGEVTPYLDQFIAAGKVVLAIDYVQDSEKIADFYDRASEASYLPYASTRNLDSLTINAGFEPD